MSEEKKALRERMKRIRLGIFDSSPAEDKLLENFINSGMGAYQTYFVYNSFSSEAPTKKLISYLKGEGQRVCLPRVEGKEMVAVLDTGDFFLSGYGIEEPRGEAYAGEIDLCILPMLAVDGQGNRLGYGGGYYDRFLSRRRCVKIAYGYDRQIVERVPSEETDIAADAILTEERFVWIKETKR